MPRKLLLTLVLFAIGAAVVLAESLFAPARSLSYGALMAGAGALMGWGFGAAGSIVLRERELLVRYGDYALFAVATLIAICWSVEQASMGHGALGGLLGALLGQGILNVWRKRPLGDRA
jgi:hypothetical protein